jgi:hypothetical protein
MCNPLRAPEGVGPVSLREVVEALERFGDRYMSVACFADDVVEVLALAGRPLPALPAPIPLQPVRPGIFNFMLGAPEEGQSYSLYVRKPGIAEVFRGPGCQRFPDLSPYATLSIQRAERHKEGKVTNIFAILKRSRITNNKCFTLYRDVDGWECFSHDFVRWVKRSLWPEPVEPADITPPEAPWGT